MRGANAIAGDARFNAGKSFRIEQLDGNLGNLFSTSDPIIRAQGDVSFNSYSGASLHILAGGSVMIDGDVTIAGADTTRNALVENVLLSNGTTLAIDGIARPTLDIRAGTRAVGTSGITGGTGGFSSVPGTGGSGTTANINIGGRITNRGGVVFLTNQYQPNPTIQTGTIVTQDINTGGDMFEGNGGTITIDARNSIITGNLNSSSASFKVPGNGGAISLYAANGTITTGNLNSSSASFGIAGNGGAIGLYAANGTITTRNLDSSSRFAESGSPGDAGAINLYAGGSISTGELNSLGRRNGGAISLYAANGNISTSSIDSSTPDGLLTKIFPNGSSGFTTGNGGAINIHAANGSISTGSLNSYTRATYGNGGAVSLYADGDITTASINSTNRSRDGSSGNITIFSNKNVSFVSPVSPVNSDTSDVLSGISFIGPGSVITSDTFGSGTSKGGDIRIEARSISLTDGSQISASTHSTGQGGNIALRASESIEISGISSNPPAGLFTQGGVATTVAERFLGGFIPTGNFEDVPPVGTQYPSGIFTQATRLSTGNAGNIFIETGKLTIRDQAAIAATTFGRGNAGNISVRTTDDITVANASILSGVAPGSRGNSGNINLQSRSVAVTAGGIVQTQTLGQGNAGNIQIAATDSVSLSNNARIRGSVEPTATGDGGEIRIGANTLSLTNGSQIITSTAGNGKAGDIILNIVDSIILSGKNTGLFASTRDSIIDQSTGATVTESGDAGQLLDSAQDLTTQPSTFPTRISGRLDSGNDVDLYKIFLTGNREFSAIANDRNGASNVVFILSPQLYLFDANGKGVYAGGALAPFTGEPSPPILPANSLLTPTAPSVYYLAISDSQNVPLSTSGRIFHPGTSIINFAASGPTGPGGSLPLNSWSGSSSSSRGEYTITLTGTAAAIPKLVTQPSGNGGNITVRARSLSVNDSAQLAAITEGIGKAGNIQVNVNTLNATNGGQLLTTTRGSGQAGNMAVNVSDRLTLTGRGTGLFANTSPGSSGDGGGIFINPRNLLIQDGAGVTVGSQGTGQGGNIEIKAGTLTLDKESFLTAETASTQGGNIALQVEDLLLLRRQSRISTNAGTEQAGGDGGNITINTLNGFVVGVPSENSDITADASSGSGGRVQINATGIFGIAPLSRLDLQRLRPLDLDPRQLPTNDITAISRQNPTLSGQVTVNTPNIDPSLGLVQLPTVVVDTPKLVASSCTAFDTGGSSFTVTGRGGLPPNPTEPLTNDVVWTDTRSLITTTQQPRKKPAAKPHFKPEPIAIVPATGWVFNGKGEVTLISNASNATNLGTTPATCPAK